MSKLPAGWAKPANATKFHYFPADEIRALCMRWMYGGGEVREDTNDEHIENCATCMRKVKALRKATA